VDERKEKRVENSDELGVTESGRKRNWVEGQKGKVDQDSFLKTARRGKRASTEQQQHPITVTQASSLARHTRIRTTPVF